MSARLTTQNWTVREQLQAPLRFKPVTAFVTAKFELPSWAGYKGGGVLPGSIFAGYVPLASHNPYPIIVYFVPNYRSHISHIWERPECNSKHSVTKYGHKFTCRNFLTHKIQKTYDPSLVNLLKMGENTTAIIVNPVVKI